ncbi:MAG: hypothetical protein V4496_04140 [Pseudomonadota bacterium]
MLPSHQLENASTDTLQSHEAMMAEFQKQLIETLAHYILLLKFPREILAGKQYGVVTLEQRKNALFLKIYGTLMALFFIGFSAFMWVSQEKPSFVTMWHHLRQGSIILPFFAVLLSAVILKGIAADLTALIITIPTLLNARGENPLHISDAFLQQNLDTLLSQGYQEIIQEINENQKITLCFTSPLLKNVETRCNEIMAASSNDKNKLKQLFLTANKKIISLDEFLTIILSFISQNRDVMVKSLENSIMLEYMSTIFDKQVLEENLHGPSDGMFSMIMQGHALIPAHTELTLTNGSVEIINSNLIDDITTQVYLAEKSAVRDVRFYKQCTKALVTIDEKKLNIFLEILTKNVATFFASNCVNDDANFENKKKFK